MITKILHKTAMPVAASLLVLFSVYFSVFTAEAAAPYGRYGWVDPITSIDGDDFSCAANEIALTLEIRDRDTGATTTVNSAIIAVFDKTVDPRVLYDWEVGSGPRIGPVCYNPDIHSVAYDVDGGGGYYDFYSSYVDPNPGIMPRQKAMTGTVWITPTGEPIEYQQVTPSPDSVTIASTSPSYTYAVNHIHDAYGADALSRVNFFVYEFDPAIPGYTNTVVNKSVNQSGGVGNKTLPAETLADGWYGWSLYLHLNRDHAIGSGVTAEDVAKSGFLNVWQPFVLDTTAPTLILNHLPAAPTEDETVTFQIDAEDTLTGVTDIEIFVDGVSIGSCTYASVYNASCSKTAGPFSSLVGHTYYAVVRDTAGNTSTSANMPFTVTSVVYPAPLSCTLPTTTVLDTAQAWSGTWYGGLQALDRVGNYAYTGASGSDGAVGLYVFDVSDPRNIIQVSFFSTHSPAAVQNNTWGNDVLSVDVEGSYAYLTTYYGGLVIVNISNPAAPTFAGKVALYGLNPPGGAKETWDVQVVGNYAFLAAGRGLIVVDVSNKANPMVVANLDLGADVSQEILVSGNYAYVAMRSNGFSVVDISNPLLPVETIRVTNSYDASSWAYSIGKKNNVLYVADHFAQRISMYNVFNPASPVLLGSIPNLPASDAKSPREIYVEGDVLYAGAGRGGVYVFDITNPANPNELYNIVEPPLDLLGGGIWGVMPLDGTGFTRLVFVSTNVTNAVYVTETQCEPTADLTAGVPSVVPGSVETGEQITITATITNTGTVAAGPYDIGNLYVDADGDENADYFIPVSRIVVNTDPASSQTISVNWTIPAAAVAGNNYRVGYFADVNNEVGEGTGDGPFVNWSGWSLPFTVISVVPPTATLSGIDCSIPFNGSTCDGSITWTINNAVDPNVYNQRTGNRCSSDSSGTNQPCLLEYGNNLIQARDGASMLQEIWVSATCIAGSSWDVGSSQCIETRVPPVIWIDAVSNIVRVGQTAEIEVGITSEYNLNCILYGAQATPSTFVHIANPLEQTYSTTTKPLNSAQVVQVMCEAGGPQTTVDTRIEVVPTVQEI